MIDEKQKAKYIKVIMCQTEWIRQELTKLMKQISDDAAYKLLKSLYQNGYTVLSIRGGSSRSAGRKEMLFIEVVNLNKQYLTYRVDYASHGSTVDILREIRKGWKPVSVW